MIFGRWIVCSYRGLGHLLLRTCGYEVRVLCSDRLVPYPDYEEIRRRPGIQLKQNCRALCGGVGCGGPLLMSWRKWSSYLYRGGSVEGRGSGVVTYTEEEALKAMVGCFNFSFVTYFNRRQQAFYRSCGLEARLVELDNGTLMSCWIPRRSKERAVTTSHKPTLVMLHAFGTSGISWSNQVGPFSKKFDLYIPDLVFFGDSSSTDTARSEFFQAESVYKLLQELNVTKFNLIGTSYGGFVAYRIAHLYPDSVQKLIISSSAVNMDPSSDEELCAKCNCENTKEILCPTTVDALKRTAALGFYKKPKMFIPRFIWADYLEAQSMKNYTEKCELADGMVLGKADSPPLETVPQETLIIWGEFDEVFNIKWAHQLKEHIGEKAQVIVIKNAGHIPQVEKTSEYNKKVLAFLLEDSSEEVVNSS
ncbi:hypothetical protein R1flu_023414 [Riccia fluitans]|uniref:AB hydrolase-1 domain-containing protein n=1 Tax=Riccia fluitans TaxID=41844 RepID=A0ABD1XRY9_9MARC